MASSADEITKFASLRDKGVISPEEFAVQKAALLDASVHGELLSEHLVADELLKLSALVDKGELSSDELQASKMRLLWVEADDTQQPVASVGESTWTPLWLSLLVLAPVGFVMALWRLAKHYGSYREVVAAVVAGVQMLVVGILIATAAPSRPANGGYYNTTVLARSVGHVVNQHDQKLGLGLTVRSTSCVLDYGSTFTCALHETGGVVVPVTVVVSQNGTEWRSHG